MITTMEAIPPLDFRFPQSNDQPPLKLLIHQEEENEHQLQLQQQHNVGFVLWPSAVLLSQWITNYPSIVLESEGDILELGAGCGLVGLTAASLIQQNQKKLIAFRSSHLHNSTDTVIFTDYNPDVCELLGRNARLNGLEGYTSVMGLDFFDQQSPSPDTPSSASWVDMEGIQRPQVPLILAADILAYSNDADLVANTIQAALTEGGRALIVSPDGNRRFGVERFPEACRDIGLQVDVTTVLVDDVFFHPIYTETDAAGMQDCCGFSQGYDFTMFTVDKPIIS
jgi:predicted nicotinamide N-methyase